MTIIYQNNQGWGDKKVIESWTWGEMGYFDVITRGTHRTDYIHKILWKRKDRHIEESVIRINKIPDGQILAGILLLSPIFECDSKPPIFYVDGTKQDNALITRLAKEKMKALDS